MRTAPFELKADLALTHAHGSSYFDAKMLASYFVSAGNFVHPVSRRDVGRDECERLDAFLKDARKAVTTAFDHREEYTAATASGRLDRLRAEAEGLMRTLFTLRSAGRPSTSRPLRGRSAAERDGNVAMVDDDARPGHAGPPVFDDAERHTDARLRRGGCNAAARGASRRHRRPRRARWQGRIGLLWTHLVWRELPV